MTNASTLLLWLCLVAVVGAAVAADLLIRRSREEESSRIAWLEVCAWILLALGFDLLILHMRGRESAIEFLTAYVVEKSLSVDNVLLFLAIFAAFRIPVNAQHRVLYYGVGGALLLRAAFLFAGIALLDRFSFLTYLFGAILLVAAAQMLLSLRANSREEPPRIIALVQRIFPLSADSRSDRFVVREGGKWKATTLLLALLAIEIVDVVFAVDSAPAVLAITRDPLIAYSSNVFAILGLRAIYLVLAQALKRMRFLHQGLAAVLAFIGAKMLLSNHVEISASTSLLVVGVIFAAAIGGSWLLGPPSAQERS